MPVRIGSRLNSQQAHNTRRRKANWPAGQQVWLSGKHVCELSQFRCVKRSCRESVARTAPEHLRLETSKSLSKQL